MPSAALLLQWQAKVRMENSRRNTKNTDTDTDNTEETEKNNKEKKSIWKHDITFFNFLVNIAFLRSSKFSFFSCFSEGSTEKLTVLSRTLKRSMVNIGLAFILYHNINQFANLRHFWEPISECPESFVWKCFKEKVQYGTKRIETFQVLAKLSFITAETELGYYHQI